MIQIVIQYYIVIIHHQVVVLPLVLPTGIDGDESHLALADREFCLLFGRLPSRLNLR